MDISVMDGIWFWFVAVMLMGSLVYGIRHTLPEYLCTFLVAGGVSTFALMKVTRSKISSAALLLLIT
jgi:UDP-galactose transporter B1